MALGAAIGAYFLAANRRCWVYASRARMMWMKLEDPSLDPAKMSAYVGRYNEDIAALKYCIRSMTEDLDRISKKCQQTIADLGKLQREQVTDSQRVDITPHLGINIGLIPGEDTGANDLILTRQWTFGDSGSNDIKVYRPYEFRLPKASWFIWGTSYEWDDRTAEAKSWYEGYMARLDAHIAGRFSSISKVIAQCKQFLEEAKAVVDLGPKRAPILNVSAFARIMLSC